MTFFKKNVVLSFCLFLSSFSFSQVAIGNTDPQGALDVDSTTDGILIPRVALVNTTTATIDTPTESELVYNTATVNDVVPGFYYWDGAAWIAIEEKTDLETWQYPILNAPATNYGGGYGAVKYYKENGRVYLSGLLNNVPVGLTIFTLPMGYRPTERLIFYTIGSSNMAARVDILTSGEVLFNYHAGTGGWLNLDGISFRVD